MDRDTAYDVTDWATFHEERSRAVRIRCWSPLGREGLVILALRKLNRQPCFFRLCTVTPILEALQS